MFSSKPILLGLTCCVGLGLSAAAGADVCPPSPAPKVVNIILGAHGKAAPNPDPVEACEGQTIRWVFPSAGHDPGTGEPAIDFGKVEKSPFTWDRRTGATVEGTVKAGAAKQGKRTEYKYAFEFNGERYDPMVIVEN